MNMGRGLLGMRVFAEGHLYDCISRAICEPQELAKKLHFTCYL
jgi:hypothetical protein